MQRDESKAIDAYHERRKLQQHLMQLVAGARDDLEIIYASGRAPEAIRSYKQQRLRQLSDKAVQAYAEVDRPAPDWWRNDLNNARLASMTLYHGLLPAFRALLERCDGNLECFYAEAEAISELDEDERAARLAALKAQA